MEAKAGPSRAWMEISQLLTQSQTADKMAKKTKLSDSGSTSSAATTTTIQVHICVDSYLIGVFRVLFFYLFHVQMLF